MELAEDCLRLAGTTFTGAAQSKAIRALALQINRQVLLLGDENEGVGLIRQESKGNQSRTYVEGSAQITLDQTARKLVEELGISLERRRVPSVVARSEFRSVFPST